MSASVDETCVQSHQIAELLAPASRRVHRAVLQAQAMVAIERALLALAGVAGAYFVLCFAYLAVGRPAPFGLAVYGWLVGAALVVPVAVTLGGALRSVPTLREVSERLDLGVADHNRIATALCLVTRDDRSAFSEAAIRDGLAHLHRLQGEKPYLDRLGPQWARGACLAAVFVVATLAAALCGEFAPVFAPSDGRTLATAAPWMDRSPAGGLEAERHELDRRLEEPPPRATATGGRQRRGAAEPGGASDKSHGEAVGGPAGGDASAKANSSDRSANSRGEATGASATTKSRSGKDRKSSAPKKSRDSRVTDAGKPEGQQSSSSISQGASGGGAMSAVHNSWSQHTQTAEGDHEECESDEETVEDENESSKQRGGVQPSLKDRNEAPSRELGISGEEGSPGAGRGGPTPPKKSRGTASLVLGIPIPDFVRGRTGPGTTKVTNERVEPSPIPGDPTVPVEVGPRSLPESPSRRFEVPADFVTVVRDYLIALHSADQRINDQSKPLSSWPVKPPSEEPIP